MISAKIQRNGSKRELLRRVDLLNNVSGIESWKDKNFLGARVRNVTKKNAIKNYWWVQL
jgi:hypothetical protein